MKKLILSAIAIAVVASTFTSCKKGSGDPGISFKSRKGRVEGSWKITEWIQNVTINNGGNTSTEETKLTDATYTMTEKEDGDTYVTNGTVQAHTINFDKKGTYDLTQNVTLTSSSLNGGTPNTYTEANTRTYSEKGTWNFLGKVDDFKNKERIVLNVTESVSNTWSWELVGGNIKWTEYKNTQKYANGERSNVMHITTLKGKEMELDGEIDNSSSSTVPGSNTNSEKGTWSAKLAQ
ncbi:MAG: hypothetical protein QY303_06245 [Vicingaceae bacterium]|nr:MAG: hypothetical protein QY303_06245 [Vicingaceae bacterium]